MAARNDANATRGCGTLLVIILVVLFVVGSCAKDAWDEGRRADRAETQGGGTVLVESPAKTCWFLSAYDERLYEGAVNGEPEDEADSSDRSDIEDAGGEFSREGCGPAAVKLPTEFIYGSVSVAVGDDDDRHNYAAWLWMSSKLVPRGGAVSVDGYDHRNSTTVFATDPSKVYDSTGYGSELLSELPFGPDSSTGLGDATKRLQKAAVDLDAFTADRRAAAEQLTSKQPLSLSEAKKGLRRVGASVAAALDTENLVRAGSDGDVPDGMFKGRPPVVLVSLLNDIDVAGGAGAAQVPALRAWLANRFLAAITPTYDSSTEYVAAARAARALSSIDPAQAARFDSFAMDWAATAKRLVAEERAEEARQQAELDALLNTSPDGVTGYYPGCDGDGDGICFE